MWVLGTSAFPGPFLHYNKKLKKSLFYDCIGIKTNITQVGLVYYIFIIIMFMFPSDFTRDESGKISEGP